MSERNEYVTRQEFESLRALSDQTSRGVAQLLDLVNKLNVKMDEGMSSLREEMRHGFAIQSEQIELLGSEQKLVRKAFTEMTTAWSKADEALRMTARNEGRAAAWEWISNRDGKLESLETRVTRLERGSATKS